MGHTPETRRRAWSKMKNLRLAWISTNSPCKICGSGERLEVDHIDRNTKLDHKVRSWCEYRRLKELSKCQVLCYRCHKEKTRKEFSKPLTHGNISDYKTRGCRCNLCRIAVREHKRIWLVTRHLLKSKSMSYLE